MRFTNIGMKLIPFVFKSKLGGSVRLQSAEEKGNFLRTSFFSTFEIIKTKTAEKVRRQSLLTTDIFITAVKTVVLE
jgi:hypothetical protein